MGPDLAAVRIAITYGQSPMTTIQMLLMSLVAGASIISCAMVERKLPRTMSDANIVSVINTIDQGELDTAYLALVKASAPVRQYAAHLVHEHTARLDKNRTLVHSMNLEPDTARLSSVLRDINQAQVAILRTKSGLDFDLAYLASEVIMHDQAIELEEDTTNAVADSHLREHLKAASSELQNHLTAAKSLQQQLLSEQRTNSLLP